LLSRIAVADDLSTRIEEKIHDLCARSTCILSDMQRLILNEGDFAGAEGLLARLRDLGEMRLFLKDLDQSQQATEDAIFAIGSETLYAAYEKLCEVKTESILYAIGSNFGDIRTVERLIPLKLDKSEMAYASADPIASSKVLIGLEHYGSLLTCYFHAHPGNGSEANHPSSIDINNHTRLEAGNYCTVGGIFSRDGYLRFFTDKMAFRIIISGKGVKRVGADLWKLTATEDVSVH